jgi:hypothetical protein
VSNWAETFPELKTRLLLVRELENNAKLRSTLFHYFGDLAIIAKILDIKSALRIMNACYRDYRKQLVSFQGELEVKDKHIYNELIGTSRNYYRNMLVKIKPRAATFKATDVIRRAQ